MKLFTTIFDVIMKAAIVQFMYAQQTNENKINVYTKFRFELGWSYLKRRREFYFLFAFCLYCSANCIAKSYFQWIFRPIFQKQLQTGREAGAKIFPLRRDENLFLDNKHKTSLLLFAFAMENSGSEQMGAHSLLGIPKRKPQICIQEQSSAENLLNSKCNRI